MITYDKYGFQKDVPNFINDSDNFQIQDLGPNYSDRFIYPGSSIKYELDGELVYLYDTLQYLFFKNQEMYYKDTYSLPLWVVEGGQDSSCLLSAELFNSFLDAGYDEIIPTLYKHLYLGDCQYLIGTVQNLLSCMEDIFVKYFVTLSSVNIPSMWDENSEMTENTLYVISDVSRNLASFLELYFIKAYSILDVVCKICYELRNNNEEFTFYKKLNCSKILWGYRKKLPINETPKTIFESCDLIRTIESLRNEAVHNGSWELHPKIYIRYENDTAVEKYMLFPDMSHGRLDTVRNRKHFFSDQIKVNDIFPSFHIEFKERLLNTIKLLNHKYNQDLEPHIVNGICL